MKNKRKHEEEDLSQYLSHEHLSKNSDKKKKKKRKKEKDEMDEENLCDNSINQENGTDKQDYSLSFSEEPLSKRKSKKRRKTDKESDENLNYNNNNDRDKSSMFEYLNLEKVDITKEKTKEKKYKEEIQNKEEKKKKKEKMKTEEEIEDSDESEDKYSKTKISFCNMSVRELQERAEINEDDKMEKNSKINRKLLITTLKHIEPNKVTIPSALKSLDYKKIADEVDEDLTPESCQQLLRKLIERKVQTKCLYQVLQETKEAILNNRWNKKRTKDPSNFNRFVAFQSKKIEEMRKNGTPNKKQRLKVAADLWHELTDMEQMKFGNPNCLGKTPFDFFIERKREKKKSVKVSEMRRLWKEELPIEKKAKFIKKSATLMMYTEEEEKKKETPISKKDIMGPSMKDILPYLNFVGMPEHPSKLHEIYYLKESGHDGRGHYRNTLMNAKKQFSALPIQEQHLWISKHDVAISSFNEIYQRFAKSDPSTAYLYDYHKEANQKKAKNKPASKTFKKTKKKLISEFNKIEMPIWKADFDGEPTVPPLTDVQIYTQKLLKKKGTTITPKEAKDRISKLLQKDQYHLECKALKIKSAFINKVLEFAMGMKGEQVKLFIGMKRLFYFKLLGEDIFEKQFPDTEFPVYVRPTKKKIFVNNVQQEQNISILNKLLDKNVKIPNHETSKKTDKSTVLAKTTAPTKSSKSSNEEFSRSETTSKKGESKAKNSTKTPRKTPKSPAFVKMDSDSSKSSDDEEFPGTETTSKKDELKSQNSASSSKNPNSKKSPSKNSKSSGFVKMDSTDSDSSKSSKEEFPWSETTSKKDESKSRNSTKSPSKNPKSSTFVKMDSDSDADEENLDSIQAYMNFLTFEKDKIESEEESDD